MFSTAAFYSKSEYDTHTPFVNKKKVAFIKQQRTAAAAAAVRVFMYIALRVRSACPLLLLCLSITSDLRQTSTSLSLKWYDAETRYYILPTGRGT